MKAQKRLLSLTRSKMLCRCVCEREKHARKCPRKACLPGTRSRFKTVWGWQTEQDPKCDLHKPGKTLAMLPSQIVFSSLASFLWPLIRFSLYILTSLLGWKLVLLYWKFSSPTVVSFFYLAALSGHNVVAYQYTQILAAVGQKNHTQFM